MELAGYGVHDTDARFRMYAIVFVGIIALGSVLYWRGQLMLSSDYVELPIHEIKEN